jgi:hypothetical protein
LSGREIEDANDETLTTVCFSKISVAKRAQPRSFGGFRDGKGLVCAASAIACDALTRL